MHQIDMHEAKLHLADFIDIALGGSHVTRDESVSVMYSTELNSTTSLVPPQRTDQHGILDQKPPDFQCLSG